MSLRSKDCNVIELFFRSARARRGDGPAPQHRRERDGEQAAPESHRHEKAGPRHHRPALALVETVPCSDQQQAELAWNPLAMVGG